MIFSGDAIQLSDQGKGLLHLQFDLQGESVNKFNELTSRELAHVVDLVERQKEAKGLLISSAKDSFIVGADVMEFGAVFAQGRAQIARHVSANARLFNRLEDLSIPTVAVINGYAFGGGLELCLACDFRVMSSNARTGLPEVKLGILPGWGGTVRLPRMVGVDTALEWMATGDEKKAVDALKAGVVDAVVEPQQLESVAREMLERAIAGKLDYSARRAGKQAPLRINDTEGLMAFETAKMLVMAKAGKHYPAPRILVETVQKAAKLPRDAAQKIELESFVQLSQTAAAKALTGIFVNDQILAKKARRWQKQAPDEGVSLSAVLGAGVMGGGIAYQSASKGVPVKMKDIDQSGLQAGVSEATRLLSRQVERGRLSPGEMGRVLSSIDPVLSYAGFEQVDIVVEAVVEQATVKKKVLIEVEKEVKADTALCSNTSSISIDTLADALQRPQNFCGMHFFNPVHKMPLVEVVRGSRTSDETIAKTVAFANRLGKKPVVVADCPGFFVNRVLFPYLAGFAMLVRDGADFREVDKVMEGFGWPMGPAYLLDVVGMDVAVHADRVMAEGFPQRMKRDFRTPMEALYEAQRLGQKKGKGFYDYSQDKKGKPVRAASEEALELVAALQTDKRTFSEDEIVARMMVPMAIEVVRCLEEKIVESPADADMALVYGLGFPPFRGGAIRWMDEMGVAAFVATARYYESLGPLYTPTENLRRLALEGKPLYGLDWTAESGMIKQPSGRPS